MVKKIVSHKPPRHLDDWLAIALLKAKFPSAEVEYVHPQRVPEEYKENPEVLLVDVGGDYNPDKGNFDHHQDSDISSSIILVLRHFFPDKQLDKTRFMEQIDAVDRYGFKRAMELTGIKPDNSVNELRKAILLSDPANEQIGKVVMEVLEKMANENPNADMNEFLKTLYKELDERGLLEEAKEQIKKEKEEFERKLKEAQVLQIGNLKVVYSKESFAPLHGEVFKRLNADIIIERNAMNPEHTSVIRNSQSPYADQINLNNIFEDYEKVFIHPTGFIAVINEKVENVDPLRITARAIGINPESLFQIIKEMNQGNNLSPSL
jgi:uncharacterized UPF0160 family protein